MNEKWSIVEVSTKDVLPLRMAILRQGTPSQDPRYPDDDTDGTVHLGIREGGALVACSTWLPRPWPLSIDLTATQLRGMAVDTRLQGSGLGGLLLRAGIEKAATGGSTAVWARARDNALDFYERNGFAIAGDQFIDDATGLGHHLVILQIVAAKSE